LFWKSLLQVPWEWKLEAAKPIFHIEGLGCVIFYSGVLYVLQLGRNEILFSVTTANFYTRLFSLHMTTQKKMFACLPSRKFLRIINLETEEVVANFRHEVDLDWITFNNDCSVVVARDVRFTLLLFDLKGKEKTVLSQNDAKKSSHPGEQSKLKIERSSN
jgi:hypothetical protein